MGFSALYWWIDRWRKSTAYMDMTLDEQGAYRNLLDEATLRGGPLPNDERILAKACGDATRWRQVRPAVMARFTLAEDGWRNETLDEVLHQTERRAAKQRRYRNGNGNGGGNESGNSGGGVGGNGGGNKPGSPDLDLDQERSKEQERSRRVGARVFTGKRLKVSQAQHALVLDELGSSVSSADLLAQYAIWDGELDASGERFDTLVYVKARASQLRAAGPLKSLKPDVDWFEECKRLHGGACEERLKHHHRMLIDQSRPVDEGRERITA